MKRTLCLGCLAVLMTGTPVHTAETGMREGQLFPDLHLPSMEDGKLLSLSSFRGKKVLLLVFASW